MAQPERFGRYRVVRRLGSGSFATVWLAHDDLLDTPVAVKVLAENWAHQLDVRHRFMEEARILRQADSAWLVRVHDIGTLADDRPYFVMTYADQGSVADLVAKGPLPVDHALRLLTEIGQGVTVLHRHGSIHRDIKPSNVLLLSSPVGQRVLVADLGFAKSIEEASGFTAVAGTPGYMSPEQMVLGHDIDVRVDVYSLGAVAYELLTGRRPSAPPVRIPPSRRRPGLPPALDELVMSALSAERAARPADAKVFTDRVRAIRRSPDLPSGVPWWLRHRTTIARTGAALVVLLSVLAGSTAAAATPGVVFTRIRNATGEISLAVPDQWSHEAQTTGWSPRELGLSGGHEPGLLAATDAAAWRGDAPVSGVFAGLLPEELAVGGPAQVVDTVPCPGVPERRAVEGPEWRGQVWQWRGCTGSSSFAAAVVRSASTGAALYLEVRQPEDRRDLVDTVIRDTRVTF